MNMIKKCATCRYFSGICGCSLYFLNVETLKSLPSNRHCESYKDESFIKPKYIPCPKVDIGRCIKNVVFNDPATIVFWADGTKTVVKTHEDDIFDPEKGLAMAISKKFFGNIGKYYDEFKKWLPDEEADTDINLESIKAFDDIRKAFAYVTAKKLKEKEKEND